MRVQGKAHVPNIYMKLADPFPCARAFRTLLCGVSNKGRLHKLTCCYLTYLAQGVDADIIYSVGSKCTNLSTQQPFQNYSFDQSEAVRLTLSSSPQTQFCASQATVALLSLMPLIQMPMSRQRLSHSNCPVHSVSRESRRRSFVEVL